MEEKDGGIENLYNRFKAELSSDADSMYYEEDELIDVFDYAGDVSDNYVRIHVLLLGNKLCPDSEALRARVGVMLDQFSVSSLDDFLSDNAACKGVLWDVLRLKNSKCGPAEIESQLSRLVDVNVFQEDEDIIQFIDLIEYYGKEDWLIANFDRLRAQCKFVDTLLYETSRLVSYSHRDVAVRMLEELTEIAPFNYDNWAKLAECYAEEGRMDDAMNALDYAKAINPGDTDLMFLEASLLLDRHENIDRAISLLQQVIKAVPSHFAAKRNLSAAFVMQGKADMAVLLWEEELRKEPSDILALMELMNIGAPDLRERVETYCDTAAEASDESALAQRVENMAITGQHDKALLWLSVYDEKFGLKDCVPVYLRELYLTGHIKEAYDIFVSRRNSDGTVVYDLPSIAIIAAILLRVGHFDDAAEFCSHYIDRQFKVNGNPEHALLVHGLRKVLSDIRDLAQAPDKIPSADYDPLRLTEVL